MAWTVNYGPQAVAQLAAIAKPAALGVINCMDYVATIADPTAQGKRLTGDLDGLWRYRVGDWRVICDVQPDQLVVLDVSLGSRFGN